MKNNTIDVWCDKLSKYDNVYFVTGFHEIQIFLENYDIKSQSNLIIIPEESILDLFLTKFISNADIGRIKDIPLGIAYWDLKYKNNSFIQKIIFQFQALIQILFLRVYLIRKVKGKINTNLFIYSYLGNIQHYIFERRFSKISTGRSIIYKVPRLNNIDLIKQPKISKRLITLIYSLTSGVSLGLYNTEMYVAFGAKNIASSVSSKNPWPLIISKFKIQLPNIEKDAVLILDAPIQHLMGVKINESVTRLEQYISNSIDTSNIYFKPHYNHNECTFDNSDILKKFKAIPKEFPAEIYMHLFSKIFFFTSSSISSCGDSTEPICLLNILAFKDQKSYKENCKIMKDSVSDRISYISFAELN